MCNTSTFEPSAPEAVLLSHPQIHDQLLCNARSLARSSFKTNVWRDSSSSSTPSFERSTGVSLVLDMIVLSGLTKQLSASPAKTKKYLERKRLFSASLQSSSDLTCSSSSCSSSDDAKQSSLEDLFQTKISLPIAIRSHRESSGSRSFDFSLSSNSSFSSASNNNSSGRLEEDEDLSADHDIDGSCLKHHEVKQIHCSTHVHC